MSKKYLVLISVIAIILLTGCEISKKEYTTEFGLSFKYPPGLQVEEKKEQNSYFVSMSGVMDEKQYNLEIAFHPARPQDLEYSCETIAKNADEGAYFDEVVSCETVGINKTEYIKAKTKGIINGPYQDVVLTKVIGDNFLRAQAVYNEALATYEEILQSFALDDRAEKSLLEKNYTELKDVEYLLVHHSFSVPPHLPKEFVYGGPSTDTGHLIKLVDLKEKTAKNIPLQYFDGGIAYLLPTNEILYTSYQKELDGKGPGSFRLYSLDKKTDDFIIGMPDGIYSYTSPMPIVFEKIDMENGQIQMLWGFNSEIGAARYLLDLKNKNIVKIGETPLFFFECMEDTDGACAKGAEDASQKFRSFVEAYGINLEELEASFYYPKEEKLYKYLTPSCKNHFENLAGLETKTSSIIGCLVAK